MAPEWLRLVVATACAVSGVAVLRRRLAPPSGALLLACAVLLVPMGAIDTSSAPHFAASSLVTPLAPLCGAVAGLWWPIRPLTRKLAVVGCAALVAGVVAGTLHTVALAPAATGCFSCPDNLLAVPSAYQHAGPFDRAGTVLIVLANLLVAGVASARWWRSTPLGRRTTWPMLLGAAGVAAVAAVHSVRVLAEPRDLFDGWAAPTAKVQLVLLLLVAAGGWWRLSLAADHGPGRASSHGRHT